MSNANTGDTNISSEATPPVPLPPVDAPGGTPPATSEKAAIDAEVQQALGGMNFDDMMTAAVNKGHAGAPAMDPNLPVGWGRRGAGGGGHGGDRQQSEGGVNPDNIKKGKIVAIREGNVFVDIGGKSQGICPIDQFEDLTKEGKGVDVGQEYEFVYKGYDAREGLVNLARRGAVTHGAWETVAAGDMVQAIVTGVNKGGLELKVGVTRAFMPAGQVDVKFHSDLSVFLNERWECVVTKVDRESHNIILSRRAMVEKEEEKKAEATWGELAVGQIREGTVRSVQQYGAFVDLGGVDGLLHVSAMSHTRVSDPKKFVKEGDKVQVMILGVDHEKKRVSLGLKQLSKDPWEMVESEFPVGTRVKGIVKRTVDFGAFVELKPGVEGLVHVSQIATKRINKPSDVVKEGQEIEAKVLSIDMDKKRISLSMSELEREARQAEAVASGAAAAPAPAAGATAAPAAPAGKPKPKKQLKGGLM